jgi:pyruvate dehydrogenase complex dehydrogenase (E1) component
VPGRLEGRLRGGQRLREGAALTASPSGCRDACILWAPDGFGRSETREALRNFFEVDHRYIVLATLKALADEGKIKMDVVKKAMKELDIDANKLNPMLV